jgi:small subunit ribosomal protein S6
MSDDAVQATLQTIRGEVEKAGGTVTSTEMIGKRVFARPMQKMEAGHYAKLLLQMPPAAIAPFSARLRLNEQVFRMQLVELKTSARKVKVKKVKPAA